MTLTPIPAGSDVYLGSILSNVHLWGIISDIATPSMMSGTFEILANDGAITLDALVGPQGIAGQNAPIVDMQWDHFDSPDDLPTNLTNTEEDIGKCWWIGNQCYVWDGTGYQIKAMGTQGPPGPVPNIHPTVELLDPYDPNAVTKITVSGTAAEPGWHMELKVPPGPQGENATIQDATDYDDSMPPELGEAIVWNGKMYQPQPIGNIGIKFYSMPEGAFTNFTGMTTRQNVGMMEIEPLEWDWVPFVTGHLRARGIEADSDPLSLGFEVLLGHPTAGTLVARGFGNRAEETAIFPHFSRPNSPNDAITPNNGLAVVHAGATGEASTLYVNLFNDGMTGVYSFNRKNAQLGVLCIPVSGFSLEVVPAMLGMGRR
jgi:hypothetical protein